MQAPAQESVTVYWDFGCTVHASAFTSARISDSVRNLRETLFPYGNILSIKAYADFSPSSTPRETRLGLSSAGVTLVDCPTDQRADLPARTLMLEALLAACEGKPPHTFAFVTADAGLAPTLATLRMRKYRVILISPLSTPKDLIEQASLNHDLTRALLGIGDGLFDTNNSPNAHLPGPTAFQRQPPASSTYSGAFPTTNAAFQTSTFDRPIHAASTGPGPYQTTPGLDEWTSRRPSSVSDPLAGLGNPRGRSNTFGRPAVKDPSPPTSRLSESIFPPPVTTVFDPPSIPSVPVETVFAATLSTSPKGNNTEAAPAPSLMGPPHFSPPRFSGRRASIAASHRSDVVGGAHYSNGRAASPNVVEDAVGNAMPAAMRSTSSAPSTPLPKSASSVFSFIDAATETAPTSAETVRLSKGKSAITGGGSQLAGDSVTAPAPSRVDVLDDSFYIAPSAPQVPVYVPPSRRASLSPPTERNARDARAPSPPKVPSLTPTPHLPAPGGSTSSTSVHTSTPIPLADVPLQFRLLVETLREARNSRASRTWLGAALMTRDKQLYEKAKVSKFAAYVQAATAAGIVAAIGVGAEAGVMLTPQYRL